MDLQGLQPRLSAVREAQRDAHHMYSALCASALITKVHLLACAHGSALYEPDQPCKGWNTATICMGLMVCPGDI